MADPLQNSSQILTPEGTSAPQDLPQKGSTIDYSSTGISYNKQVFLECYSRYGNVAESCRVARVSRHTYYDWRRDDPEFLALANHAQQDAIDALEREAVKRAMDGTEEPVYHRGELIGSVPKKSDALLIFLLKANRPEKFRERVEMTGANGGPLETVTRVEVAFLPPGQTPIEATPLALPPAETE